MAKELPYFQFEPAEYLTKDISFCSLSAQGLFINICSYYWQRQCDLSKEQFLRRFNYLNEFEELLKEGIIDIENEKIKIKFLDNQYLKATEFSKEQSRKGSLGGRPKKPIESQIKPEINPNESQTKAIIKDNIKEDNITPIIDVGVIEFNDAFNICLFDENWKEDIERMYKVDRDKVRFALAEFKTHCGTIGENKPKTLNQFKKHFTNWVRVKKQYQVKTEIKDKL